MLAGRANNPDHGRTRQLADTRQPGCHHHPRRARSAREPRAVPLLFTFKHLREFIASERPAGTPIAATQCRPFSKGVFVGTRHNPLSNLRSAPEPQHIGVNVLRRRIITMRNSRTLAPPNPVRAAASPAVSEEWSLIQQAIGGDSRAQKQIFTCYTAKLHRTAFAILRNREDAEDAVQE